MERALSAPGKLMLSGEYAVLWGGTARVAAVDPRVGAYVRRRPDREVHLVLEEGRCVGRATPAGVNWNGAVPPGFVFAARALDEVLRAQGRESLGFELALGASPKSEEGHKLGLGGSARAVVLAADAARFVLEARADALKLALLAHASVQGSGSGADVAACFAGGLIRYRRYETAGLAQASQEGRLAAAVNASPPVEVFRLAPSPLRVVYVFSGVPASTPSLIAQVESRFQGEKRARFAARSEEWGQALEDTLLRGDLPGLSQACAELQALLVSLGPLETEEMRRILALAKSHGAAGKLSGAGGGDGCVLFCHEGDAAELVASLKSRGFFARPLVLEAGLRGESAPAPALRGWLNAAVP